MSPWVWALALLLSGSAWALVVGVLGVSRGCAVLARGFRACAGRSGRVAALVG